MSLRFIPRVLTAALGAMALGYAVPHQSVGVSSLGAQTIPLLHEEQIGPWAIRCYRLSLSALDTESGKAETRARCEITQSRGRVWFISENGSAVKEALGSLGARTLDQACGGATGRFAIDGQVVEGPLVDALRRGGESADFEIAQSWPHCYYVVQTMPIRRFVAAALAAQTWSGKLALTE